MSWPARGDNRDPGAGRAAQFPQVAAYPIRRGPASPPNSRVTTHRVTTPSGEGHAESTMGGFGRSTTAFANVRSVGRPSEALRSHRRRLQLERCSPRLRDSRFVREVHLTEMSTRWMRRASHWNRVKRRGVQAPGLVRRDAARHDGQRSQEGRCRAQCVGHRPMSGR